MKTNLAGGAITGLGVICPIGKDIDSMCVNLQNGKSGISEIRSFSTEGLSVHHAAQIVDYVPSEHFAASELEYLDRTAQLAVIAARQAVKDAGLSKEELASGKIGLVMGICAGGIGDGSMPALPENWTDITEVKRGFYHTTHFAQTQAVAEDLGLRGPCYTVSTACASSTSALAAALTLLESGQVEAVVVGGADAYSLSIYAGFYSLGAMSEKPTSPFSLGLGATFGEGAGCIVIENETRVARRNPTVHGMLMSVGCTSDAHHITSPHPSGEGLKRAMNLAIADANLKLEAIQYVNMHGTGTLDNDISETLAVQTLFKDGNVPAVSSSKSYFGHTLGGAGILEFIASLIGLKNGFLPATINFQSARQGCDLDCVPNTPRPFEFNNFLSNSAAFGGVNAVAVGARTGTAQRHLPAAQKIVISGIGVMSPIGIGVEEFRQGLLDGKDGLVGITRFDLSGKNQGFAGLIPEFSPRKLLPTIDVRRMDNFTRYAVITTAMAVKDAKLAGRYKPDRIGLHVAMTRGPVETQLAFHQSLVKNGIAGLSAKYFPSMVLSTISGQIAQACQIKGANFTFVDGVGAGLQVLAHAHHYLALHPELDALLVVAVDEVGELSHGIQSYLGQLAANPESFHLYSEKSNGFISAEGAVAFVLEREEAVSARTGQIYAAIDASVVMSEGVSEHSLDVQGEMLEHVVKQAIEHAEVAPDIVYGMARGEQKHDQREANVLHRLLDGKNTPLVCLNGQLGLADATSSLFAATAAMLSLRYGEAYRSLRTGNASNNLPLQPDATVNGNYRHALVISSSEFGNNAAVMLSKLESA